ncbi:MAG: hypothetical protein HN969_15295 [Verrucomicrobia bacterium]|nr:hypothetical protein [Verrucomicrobiota bacterium]
MKKDSTNPNQIRPPEVSDQQSIAIDALVAGATHREAAKAAGACRSTVTGWVNHNITFITELNQRRQSRLVASGETLHQTMAAALSLLAEKIDAGDAEVALALVKAVGVEHLVQAAIPGPVTPLGVHARLANQVNADLTNELFIDPTASDLVEKRSGESCG